MADDERPAVGTVAEEAARLLDALGGWAASTRTGYAAEPGQESDAPTGAAKDTGRCESCGAENGMGRAVTCQLCPVCQGIGLLRSVRPETVDRLADLAGALAATLRDIAGQRRASDEAGQRRASDEAGQRRASDGAGPTKSSGQASRGRVHDITVDDEDEPDGTEGSATS